MRREMDVSVQNRDGRPESDGKHEAPFRNPERLPVGASLPVKISVNPTNSSATPAVKTDEQLLAAYRQGDRESFAKLVERYQRELFHFLVRFLGDRAAAEDCFQESFLQVHQSADTFDPQRRFRPWLFTIAANKARDLIRAQSRRPTSPLQASISPNDGDGGGEFIDLLQSICGRSFCSRISTNFRTSK
jgi:hypothetical protein